MNIRLLSSLLLFASLAPAAASAQLARPRTAAPDAPKLLVAPLQRDPQDSALSLLVADGVRDRLRSNHLDKFNTIPRNIMNENLVQSGFPVDVPLESRVVRDLVRFLNARYVIEGTMQRKAGDSVQIIARLSEGSGQEPQTVTRSVTLPAGQVRQGTGADLAQRLVEGQRSFDDVTQCRQAVEQNNLARAMQEVNEALRDYPNSASAYMCMARILEAQNASADSVLVVLRRAYDADTLNVVTMRRLANRYETRGDTANLVNMLRRILDVDFRDKDLRINTARLLVTLGRIPDAAEVIEQGLRQDPANADLLAVKMRAMAALSRFDSALAVADLIRSIDTTKVDSTFIFLVTNYARQANDTTKLIEWATIATQKMPTQAANFYTLASIYLQRADTNRALEAVDAGVRSLPANAATSSNSDERGLVGRFSLIKALVLSARQQSDSALAYADIAVAADSAIRAQVAFVPLIVGARLRGDSTQLERSVELLSRSMQWGAANPRVVVQAGFQLAVAQIQLAVQVDRVAEGERNCDASRRLQTLMNDAETSLNTMLEASRNPASGGLSAQQRQVLSQLLSETIPGYKQRAEQLIRNNCR